MTEYIFRYESDDFLCLHKLDKQPANNCTMHTHDTIEIYYFISGCCYYLVEGTKYELTPHDILIIRPYEAHKLTVGSARIPYERIVINAKPDIFSSIDTENILTEQMLKRPLGTGNCFKASDFGHKICSDCFETIASDGEKSTRTDLLSKTLLILNETAKVLENGKYALRDDLGSRLIYYVNENIFKDITLDNLCREFYVSKSQINRIFKKYTGASMGQYIGAKRILAARNMILSGESASRVCYECGYSDYSAFYRAYVKRFGVSPRTDKSKE